MATTNETNFTSEYLLQQLGNWKLIAAAYSYLFDKDPVLKEFLAFKMDIVQGLLDELQSWEETGNETKCRNVIDHAEFYLGQIQTLFDRMFANQDEDTGHEMGEQLIYTDYFLVTHIWDSSNPSL